MEKLQSSNASGSARGWEFQFAAGIHIFLVHIDEVFSLKIEGDEEDIEVTLTDSSLIYAQAKCVTDIEDDNNVKSNYEKAIVTLARAGKGNAVRKLIFITNSPNPFGIKRTISFFLGVPKHKYSALPNTCKKKILQSIEKSKINLNTDILEIWILPFFGEEENRYSQLIMEIEKFLATIKDTQGLSEKLLSIWRERFSINAGNKDTSVVLRKEELIWPIIALASDRESIEAYTSSYDAAARTEISREFSNFIHVKADTFLFSNKVINAYYDYCDNNQLPLHQQKSQDSFISSERNMFSEDFTISTLPTEIRDILMELVIKRILRLRYLITEVKERVGL